MTSSKNNGTFISRGIGLGIMLVLLLLVSGCTQQAATPAGTTTSPAIETPIDTANATGGMGLLARPATALQTIAKRTMVKPTISFRPPSCSGTQTLCGVSCTDKASDPDNCGACGNVCSTYPNMNQTCSGGTCRYTCFYAHLKNYQDCNKNIADGCEVNIANDDNNCGGCGNVCGAGLMCESYSCREPLKPVGAGTYNPPASGQLG